MNKNFFNHVTSKWNRDLDVVQTFDNIIHGVAGEFLEIIDKDYEAYCFSDETSKETIERQKLEFLDECGDLLFYISRWVLFLREEYENLDVTEKYVNCNPLHFVKYYELIKPFNILVGQSKKFLYHNKPFDYFMFDENILTIYSWLLGFMEQYEFDLEQVMSYNIEKLNKRHGDSFKNFNNRLDS